MPPELLTNVQPGCRRGWRRYPEHMAEKRGRGRPPLAVKREHVKNVHFTEDERLEVEAAASEMPVARWIREAALEKARRA